MFDNFKNLTILIPTRNRSHFLDRALLFYSNSNFNCKFLIGDSSTSKQEVTKVKNVVKKYKNNLKISLFIYKANMSFGDKLNYLVNKANDDFVAIIGDDDVFINSGLRKCIDFLINNKSSVAAFGHRVTFKIACYPDNSDNWYLLNQIRSKGLMSDNYKNRIQIIDTLSWSQYIYAVYRRDTIKNSLKVIKGLKYSSTTENLLYYSIAIAGKWKKINTLFSIIGFESNYFKYKDRNSFPDYWGNVGSKVKQLSTSTFSKDFSQGIKNIQSLYKNKIDDLELRNAILSSFWSNNSKYLNERMRHLHIDKKKLLSSLLYKTYVLNYKVWHFSSEYSFILFFKILLKELRRPYFWKILFRKKKNIDQEGRKLKNYIFIIKTLIHHGSLDYTDEALKSKENKFSEDFSNVFDLWKRYPFGISKKKNKL